MNKISIAFIISVMMSFVTNPITGGNVYKAIDFDTGKRISISKIIFY